MHTYHPAGRTLAHFLSRARRQDSDPQSLQRILPPPISRLLLRVHSELGAQTPAPSPPGSKMTFFCRPVWLLAPLPGSLCGPGGRSRDTHSIPRHIMLPLLQAWLPVYSPRRALALHRRARWARVRRLLPLGFKGVAAHLAQCLSPALAPPPPHKSLRVTVPVRLGSTGSFPGVQGKSGPVLVPRRASGRRLKTAALWCGLSARWGLALLLQALY